MRFTWSDVKLVRVWCVSPHRIQVVPDPENTVDRTRPHPLSWRRYKWYMATCGSTLPDSSDYRGEEEENNPMKIEKRSRKKRTARYQCTVSWGARRSHNCKSSTHKRASSACASRSSSHPPLPDGAQQQQQVQLTPSNLFTLGLGPLLSPITSCSESATLEGKCAKQI